MGAADALLSAYTEGVIAKFLNATTADGYNPYRVTRSGIEWEVPEPDNPWSNIGYWSDHQIIYLQKLLEIAEHVHPGQASRSVEPTCFCLCRCPLPPAPLSGDAEQIGITRLILIGKARKRRKLAVAESAQTAVCSGMQDGNVIHVTMVEKLLVLLLAKLTNLVPEGGIWMNTQRPEWNDANNALVGKGLSVVTVAYLRRFIAFWQTGLAGFEKEAFKVNTAVSDLFSECAAHSEPLSGPSGNNILMTERAGHSWMIWAQPYHLPLPPSMKMDYPAKQVELISERQSERSARRGPGLSRTYAAG